MIERGGGSDREGGEERVRIEGGTGRVEWRCRAGREEKVLEREGRRE